MINKSEKLIGHIVSSDIAARHIPAVSDELQQGDDTSHSLDSQLITDDKNIVNFSAARLLSSGLNVVPYPLIYKIPLPPYPHTYTHQPTRQLDALLSSGRGRGGGRGGGGWSDVTSEIAEDGTGNEARIKVKLLSRTTSLEVKFKLHKNCDFPQRNQNRQRSTRGVAILERITMIIHLFN